MTLFFSRLRLSEQPSAQALSSLIAPQENGARLSAQHQLLWSAFTDGPDRRRDFLWREEGRGVFFTLSERPPAQTDLFAPIETKPFAPILSEKDQLIVKLRANATRALKGAGRTDVVMAALHALPRAERAQLRMEIAQREGAAWLSRQGEQHGFRVLDCKVEGYGPVALPRNRRSRSNQPQFGILDITGQLEVADPEIFLSKLKQGFGRAKAFGCGLMLIRRAQ